MDWSAVLIVVALVVIVAARFLSTRWLVNRAKSNPDAPIHKIPGPLWLKLLVLFGAAAVVRFIWHANT